MRPRWFVALCVLTGCKFSVRPLATADAAVPLEDFATSNAVDDLTLVGDLARDDFALAVDLQSLPPDMRPNCGDGVQNGSETDVDCGGSCPPCSTGRKCGGTGDCLSTHCLVDHCVECFTNTQCGVPLAYCVQNACDDVTSGLIAYWAMDDGVWTVDCATDTVTDSSGHGHAGHSCPANTGPSISATAKYGTAGAFGPTEQHIDIPMSNAFDPGTGDFTVSLWANFTSLAADTPVLDSQSTLTSHQVLIHHVTTGWAFEVRAASMMNNVVFSQNALTTTTGVWHHLAMVRASNVWTLYLDGTSIVSATSAIALLANNGLVLGWSLDNAKQLNGYLDEYRIYGRALSAAELTALSQ